MIESVCCCMLYDSRFRWMSRQVEGNSRGARDGVSFCEVSHPSARMVMQFVAVIACPA